MRVVSSRMIVVISCLESNDRNDHHLENSLALGIYRKEFLAHIMFIQWVEQRRISIHSVHNVIKLFEKWNKHVSMQYVISFILRSYVCLFSDALFLERGFIRSSNIKFAQQRRNRLLFFIPFFFLLLQCLDWSEFLYDPYVH